jgi:hypothetical protein
MKITVESIGGMDIANNDKMDAHVLFFEEIEGYGFSAKVTVWLPKSDDPLSDLKKEAVLAAIDFLKKAQAAHSG